MVDVAKNISDLPEGKRAVFYQFMAFTDSFSINWFSHVEGILPSHMLSVISFLKRWRWIEPSDVEGFYFWTKRFPREEIIRGLPEKEMSRYYRDAADILSRHLTDGDEKVWKIVQLYLLSGIRESDLNIILRAALLDEKRNRYTSAVNLYNKLLTFMEMILSEADFAPSGEFYEIFKAAIERRTAFCFSHPSLRKLNRWIEMSLNLAVQRNDLRSQGVQELLAGMNDWMNFRYEQATLHLDRSWEIIQQIGDKGLEKKCLQLRGLSFWTRGELSNALQAYEESLGELDDIMADDFSLMTGWQLAMCYAQVGMPQRGLGIVETIYARSIKTENWTYVAAAFLGTGIILLKMNHIKESRAYLERCLEITQREGVTSVIDMTARLHLANICCIEGDHRVAKSYLSSDLLNKFNESHWKYIFNNVHNFESSFMLTHKGLIQEFNRAECLDKIDHEILNPFLHAIIRRMQIKHLEEHQKPQEKIKELMELEKFLKKIGAKMELGNIRIDLARLYQKTNGWPEAESYGRSAWELLKTFAKSIYPSELRQLLCNEDLPTKMVFLDLISEVVATIASIEENEHVLGALMNSISRITGAERVAIFRKETGQPDLQMVASRNLTREDLTDQNFREITKTVENMGESNNAQTIMHERILEATSETCKIIISSLYVGGKTIGFLYQDSRFFLFDMSLENIKSLNALVSQIAMIIDRTWAHEEITRLNEKLFEVTQYYKDEKETLQPFGEIIGYSPPIMKIHGLIQKVAAANSTVLIQGETGVGKELVARAIHRESDRKEGPFIRVNCAALPNSLIDSELFGHEQGAFTGATRMKPGRFELAHKGTIFLDEISELPLPTQSRLLRILQEKEFQRVGGTKTLHVDFRLLAATNKNLEKEVEAGRFRQDLFYRINVFPIKVPALRERKEDIAPLAIHFMKLFSSQCNKSFLGIRQSEMEKLKTYNWPGNVRELANVIERTVILGESVIRFMEQDLISVNLLSARETMPLKEIEKHEILKAIQKTKGRVGGKNGAATLLGLKRTTLINRMIKLGIYNSRHDVL